MTATLINMKSNLQLNSSHYNTNIGIYMEYLPFYEALMAAADRFFLQYSWNINMADNHCWKHHIPGSAEYHTTGLTHINFSFYDFL